MAAVNYSSWPVARLKKEQEKIERALKSKEGRERDKALQAIHQVARKNGFELSELVGGNLGGTARTRSKKKAAGRKTGKVAPKYRNPNDSDVTWSGRGRKPLWIVEHLKKNDDLDDLAI